MITRKEINFEYASDRGTNRNAKHVGCYTGSPRRRLPRTYAGTISKIQKNIRSKPGIPLQANCYAAAVPSSHAPSKVPR